MQSISLKIPEDKLPFFMELIHNLEFVKVTEKAEDAFLPAEQIKLTEAEFLKADSAPDYMLDFDMAWESIKAKK